MVGIELLLVVQPSIGQGANALCFENKIRHEEQKVVIKLGRSQASRFCSTQSIKERHQISDGLPYSLRSSLHASYRPAQLVLSLCQRWQEERSQAGQ